MTYLPIRKIIRLFFSLQPCVALLMFGTAHNVMAESTCLDRSDSQPAMLVDTEEQQALRSNLSPGWKSDETGRLIRFGAYIGMGPKSKQKRPASKFERQCFIPGQFEGVAVAMPNSEVFQQ